MTWYGLRWVRQVLLTTVLTAGVSAGAQAQQAGDPARKSPALALALSVLVPGGGQLYNGHHLKAAGVFGGTAATFSALILTASDVLGLDDDTSGTGTHVLGAAGLGILLWSWIDAPLSAREINRRFEAERTTVEVGPSVEGLGSASGLSVSLVRVGF